MEKQRSEAPIDEAAGARDASSVFERAVEIMRHLRGPEGCPWDREQTFDSIKPYTLEETYEVFDAIERRAWPDLKDELGDLLLQVLFYAQMADDEGHFNIIDVLENLNAKLVRRHPHVFGEADAADASAVLRTWEQVKKEEKKNFAPQGRLDDIPRSMPALLEAYKISSRAAKIGFDWQKPEELFAKLDEEQEELRAEIVASEPKQAAIEEEFGDLLFVAVNLARHLKVAPEDALRGANAKFRRRFAAMERFAGGSEPLAAMAVSQMEELWTRAKEEERKTQ
jgi:XTP/dITP diphosphohydrolase/ATP diphosphatase